MGITRSYQNYLAVPSAILSDGIITIPLWAVTEMSLTASYQLPPIGSTNARAVVPVSQDRVSLRGLLAGTERYIWKFALESLAESSKRGSALAAMTGGAVGGLILVTSMTIRTDMQVEELSFHASSSQRDVLDVSIGLAHVPRPGALSTLLDVASIGVAALADWGGN